MSSSDEDSYGPPLPPGMRQGSSSGSGKCVGSRSKSFPVDASDDEVDRYGPTLSHSKRVSNKDRYGSSSPPNKKDSEDDSYGPSLPPSEKDRAWKNCSPSLPPANKNDGKDRYGPSLPPSKADSEDESYGPALPPARVLGPCRPSAEQLLVTATSSQQQEEESDDEEVVIGPMPSSTRLETGLSRADSVADEFERRALAMKDKLDPNRKSPEAREQWMLELPEYHAKQFGLGGRQFRRSAAPERGDTSCWTDTPADRHKRANSDKCSTPTGGETESLAVRRRDERIAAVAGRLKDPDSRHQSLLDQHRKRRREEEKVVADSSTKLKRQPFDRDRDLGAKMFDQAQKNAAIRRSRGAADMFSSGAQKFL